MKPIDRLARTLLFEGYVLYPYRADSTKNRQRWSFGTLYPEAWCAAEGSDNSTMQTEILVRGDATLAISVRFLHLLARVTETDDDWNEAREHAIAIPPFAVAALEAHTIRAGVAGGIVDERRAEELAVAIELSALPIADDVRRIRIRIANATPLALPADRRRANLASLASTHTAIEVTNGALISLLEPPPELADAAAACVNQGTWPVLIGAAGATDTMLSSPIILYDYPALAPESATELYDATEIDEILTLRILALSDDEKAKVRALDPRARAILERCERLSAGELAAMHGAMRAPSHRGSARDPISGLGVGDRVTIRAAVPTGSNRTDVFDVVLAGKRATIVGVETDLERNVMFAVAFDDDPGRDLGVAGQIGHRFYFRAPELEVIS